MDNAGHCQLYSLKDVEAALNVSNRTLMRRIKAKQIEARKIGGAWHVTKQELDRLIRENELATSNYANNDKQANNDNRWAHYDISDITAILDAILDVCPIDGPQWKIVIKGAIDGADMWLDFLLAYKFPRLDQGKRLELAKCLKNEIEGQKWQIDEVVDDPIEAENLRHELNLKNIAVNQAIERYWEPGPEMDAGENQDAAMAGFKRQGTIE